MHSQGTVSHGGRIRQQELDAAGHIITQPEEWGNECTHASSQLTVSIHTVQDLPKREWCRLCSFNIITVIPYQKKPTDLPDLDSLSSRLPPQAIPNPAKLTNEIKSVCNLYVIHSPPFLLSVYSDWYIVEIKSFM